MTNKLEELQAELQKEKDRIVNAFHEKAADGDYAVLDKSILGVLVKRVMARGGEELVFYPITIRGINTDMGFAMMMDPDNVVRLELLGKEPEKLDKFIKSQVKEYQETNATTPF
jgi:hypothetical protein